jgi:hypothetical protein
MSLTTRFGITLVMENAGDEFKEELKVMLASAKTALKLYVPSGTFSC